MKVLTTLIFALLLTQTALAQEGSISNNNRATNPATQNVKKKRGPVFRASKEQVSQAQAILKGRNLYAGEQTGKLDDATRAALKKYQAAENLKVTGTLNRATLEKMNIALTDGQKAM
jgi:peptidoglycan hydrolase-like protein with peptidoglycan-binding domain